MHLSPFFQNLRSAYVAELEDMSHDSEGRLILNQRLAQRRGEIEFLIHMLEISPEMVAVVFHKAFSFTSVPVMNHLLANEPDELPDWDVLAETIDIAPWAAPLVKTIRKQAAGDWFLCVAVALEYMASHSHAQVSHPQDDHDADAEKEDHADDPRHLGSDDADDTDARTREEAGADWMVEQGFDRKE